jgi:hypothetical protein
MSDVITTQALEKNLFFKMPKFGSVRGKHTLAVTKGSTPQALDFYN